MKSFRQIISEQEPNDKLDKLIHNIPLSKKRLNQLTSTFPAFEDIDLEQWQGYPPPSNSSQVVRNEINYIISTQQIRSRWRNDILIHDEKIMELFKEYLNKHSLEVDLSKIKSLLKQSNPILLSLKRYYNRPRPVVLAKQLGISLTSISLKTAETPSYPSGHAAQGRLLAKLIADEVPFQHRRDILAIGEDIGQGRQIAGAHYPSDTEFGHRLGDELYRLATTSKEPELKLEQFKMVIISEAKMKKDDLFKRQNKSIFIDKTERGDLLDTDGNKLSVKDKSLWNQLKQELLDASDTDELPNWTPKNLNKVFGVTKGGLGQVEKTANGMGRPSSGNPTGEDWESGISVGLYYNNNDGKLPLDSPEWKRFEKYWGDWSKQAIKTASEFEKKVKVKTLEQTGSKKAKGVTKEWKGRNTTPKTDLLSGNKRISLKKAGGSQLLSAGKDEAISTVEAAMRRYSASKNGQNKIDSLLDNMEQKMIKLSTKDTITSITDLKDKKTLTPADKKKIAEYELGDSYAKELTTQMGNLFNTEQKMKDYFCWEAATGEGKFGKDTWPTANELVTFKEGGGISNYLPLYDPDKAGGILAKGNSFYVSFKSSSGSPPYLSLRSKKVKLTAGYQPTFADIIQEECSKERAGMKVLHECRIEQLNEFQMLNKLWKQTKGVAKSIATGAKKVISAIMKRMSAAFKWIKKQGRRLMDAVLNFFGLDMSIKKLKGGGKYPIV